MVDVLKMKDKTDNFIIDKDYIPSLPFRGIISARSGMGKSNLLGFLLCSKNKNGYFNDFPKSNIFVFSGSLNGDYKLKQMIKYLKIDESNTFDTFDNDIVNEIYDMLVEEYNDAIADNKKPKHSLFIFDDLGYKNTMNKRIEDSAIDKIFCNGRKYNISIMVLNQRINQSNRTCLSNASFCVIFKPNNSDLDLLSENFNYLDNKDKFKRLVRKNTNGRDFLVIDFSKKDIYRNKKFEPIKICECEGKKNECGGFK